MRVNRCPNCQEPLPRNAKHCAKCGEDLPGSKQWPEKNNAGQADPTVIIADRPAAFKASRFFALDTGVNARMQRRGPGMTVNLAKPGQNSAISDEHIMSPPEQTGDWQEDGDDYEIEHHATWNKVVNYKTPRTPPALIAPIPARPADPGPPKRSMPPGLIQSRKAPPKRPGQGRISPRLFSWISVLVLVGLSLGGIFGLVISLSKGIMSQSSHNAGLLTLQVAPSTIAPGGIITLRGSHFSPSGRVGLTRDANIAIVDTGGERIIRASGDGSFSDTVIVDQAWGAGAHIIRAEDAILHKSASFTVTVTGQSASLRPAHLLFSMDAIDLGSGDQATGNTKMIKLSDAGGGQISWQATATQSWLMISPTGGTFSSGQSMQVAVAGDRSNLKVGPYSASLVFTSNTGQAALPVKMTVTPLQPGHEAVLQLSPSVLSFTGTDGSINPPGQVVTVSNPGVLALQWSASSSTDDGINWLSVYPQSGTVTKGSSQPVTIGVDISAMLPGVYSGSVTFASQGIAAAKDSPRIINISLVVMPQCSIQVSPGGLTFSGVSLQPSPTPKTVTVGVSQGCSTAIRWSAAVTTNSGGHWLAIGSTSGVTPAYPSVSVAVAGLKPGAYTGSVMFSWYGGTQTLPVTLIMGQPATPIMAVTPATLSFSGIAGQAGPASQLVTITSSGSGTLTWHAAATTSVGGAWLAITPVTGTLASHLSATVTVTVKLLGTLTAGTYTGTINVTGTDSAGNPAAGSPQVIPVTFIVQAPCTIATTPAVLRFQGVIGQPDPAAQAATITASSGCVNALTWTATTATAPVGGTWLSVTPATGTVDPKNASTMNVGVVLKGLTAGRHTGTVTVSAIDSVTKKAVGTPQTITVTVTVKQVQQVCTLQVPSAKVLTFSAGAGLNPPAQTFTIGVTGSCTGNINITPTGTVGSGTGWLAVTPASATVVSGGSATVTVTVTSAALAAGSYTGSISLSAANGGIAMTGSPQTVGVTLNVLIRSPTPFPPPTPTSTPSPSPSPTSAPSPSPTSTPSPSPSPTSTPSPTPTPTPSLSPSSSSTPSLSPTRLGLRLRSRQILL